MTETGERSLHEETVSDARKLAREINEDVMAGEDEIAAAIQAGFDYRERRLLARAEKAEAEIARLTSPLEGAKVSAEELAEWRQEHQGAGGETYLPTATVRRLIDSLHHATAQVRLAREEEREACARLAERKIDVYHEGVSAVDVRASFFRSYEWNDGPAIAAAIRNRETDNG